MAWAEAAKAEVATAGGWVAPLVGDWRAEEGGLEEEAAAAGAADGRVGDVIAGDWRGDWPGLGDWRAGDWRGAGDWRVEGTKEGGSCQGPGIAGEEAAGGPSGAAASLASPISTSLEAP